MDSVSGAELLAYDLTLRQWLANPGASQREIGVLSAWTSSDSRNDAPPSAGFGQRLEMSNFATADLTAAKTVKFAKVPLISVSISLFLG